MTTIVVKRRGAAAMARQLGHRLGAWTETAFVRGETAQCQDCGRQALLAGGRTYGDALEKRCR